MRPIHITTALACGLLLLALTGAPPLRAQETPAIAGHWVVNKELSDDTDKAVAKALRAMGQKVKKCWFGCEEDRFRGGPAEQELYDRLSYDKTLTITLDAPAYQFTYDDDFQRPVYTDGRSRSVSLTGLDEIKDFSFAHWENGKLLVEARPRDGGFANETYSLIDNGSHLQVELYIEPDGFTDPVELVRVFDRVNPVDNIQR